MQTKPREYQVEPGGELAKLLDEAATVPVTVELNGVRYRLTVQRIPSQMTPEEWRTYLESFANTFTPEEGEHIKQMIYERREIGVQRPEEP